MHTILHIPLVLYINGLIEARNNTNSIKDVEVLTALQVYITVFWVVAYSVLVEVMNVFRGT
jgi:hypothetical protein